MRRLLPLLSSGFITAVLALAAPAAEAASGRDNASQQRVSAQRAAKPAATTARSAAGKPAAPAQRSAAAPAQRGGKPNAATRAQRNTNQAAAACSGRQARNQRCSNTSRPVSWQGGLPAMTMAQTGCPAGTVALLARGHDDVTRCMPI